VAVGVSIFASRPGWEGEEEEQLQFLRKVFEGEVLVT
jgi:hypothetical protein